VSELTKNVALPSKLAPQSTDNSAQREVRLPYMPALDGPPRIGRGGVLIYHADMPWMPGGFLGVEVFFVLSGYLITSCSWPSGGVRATSTCPGSVCGGIRRLLPAMLLMTAASITYAVLFLPEKWQACVAMLCRSRLCHELVPDLSRTSYFESVAVHRSYATCGRWP